MLDIIWGGHMCIKIPYHTLWIISYKFKAHRWVREREVTATLAMLACRNDREA